MPKWTDEQLSAIDKDNSNIIVSAGAGSGKTAVLTARVIRKLKSGVDITKLLVLTFTNEAASEMKARIRASVEKDPSLKEQLDYIDQAYITTFDSYALSIVKKYHYALGISKDIDIVDSSIIDLLKSNYLDEVMNNKYEMKDQDFLKLISDFCVKNDDKIKKAILSINKKLDLKYDKKRYLENYINNYYNDDYLKKLFDEYVLLLNNKIKEIKDILYDISIKVDGKIYEKYLNSLSLLLDACDYNSIKENVNISLPIVRGSDDIKFEKELIKNILKELQGLCIYDSFDDIKNIYYSTMPYAKSIIDIILELDKKVLNFKKEHLAYEFIDISKMAIRVVEENSDIALELKNYYNEIMVDEYQDTNDLQEMFISAISNNNVYMVGDIKQSIYRFRNANPSIFKNKYENYALGNGGIKIDLLKNFRSRSEVLDDINILFDKVMDSYIGGASYKESHRMVFGNNSYVINGSNDINHHLEIYNYSNEDKTYSKSLKEIFIIANDIKNKVNSNYTVLDKETNTLRPITYNDFCIILDRGKEFNKYRKVFEYLGIPLAVYEDQKLTVEYDILTLKNLINMILLLNKVKIDDKKFLYSYVSVARSFLFNYSDSEIYNYINDLELLKSTSLYQKCLEISDVINTLSPVMLLNAIMDKFNYYEMLITAFDIDKALIRIDYLNNIALNLEKLGYTNEMFLTYLDNMINDKDSDIKYKVNTKGGNSVKLMNIHKSKGLEFPICYFAGFDAPFNTLDLKSRFLFDDTYGIITPYFKDGIGSFINKSLYTNKYYLEEISEKIRLFYVATTRAREKMIIVTSLSNDEVSLCDMVSDNIRLRFRSFLDILESIKFDLVDYIKDVAIDNIGITKNYSKVKDYNYSSYIEPNSNKIILKDLNLNYKLGEEKHFSKSNMSLISKEDKLNMLNGIKLHEIFEREDFSSSDNSYVNRFLKHDLFSNIKDAKIYKEYEFMYNIDNSTYHGIIDLMLVYDDHVDIIDYKMYHVLDDAYKDQLMGYKNYISSKLNLPVRTYLYAILPDVIEEIK